MGTSVTIQQSLSEFLILEMTKSPLRKRRLPYRRLFIALSVIFILFLLLVFGFKIFSQNEHSSQKINNIYHSAQDEIASPGSNLERLPETDELESQGRTFPEILKYFNGLAKEKSPEYAFDVLRQVKLPPGTDYHLIAHEIGDVLYEAEGIGGMRICNSDFGSACSHQVLINFLVDHGEKEMKQVFDTCKNLTGLKVDRMMCFHGVGHGMLGYTEYDLQKAVDHCSKLRTKENDPSWYSECIGGVAMEMIFGLHAPEIWSVKRYDYFIDGEPLSLCQNPAFSGVEERTICYTYITPQIFFYMGADLVTSNDEQKRRAIQVCEQIPKGQSLERRGCFGGFGKEFLPLANGKDIRTMDRIPDETLLTAHKWCNFATSLDGRKYCVIYAMSSAYWGGYFSYKVPLRFCELADNDEVKKNCFIELGQYIGNLSNDPAEKRQYCREDSQKEDYWCRDFL